MWEIGDLGGVLFYRFFGVWFCGVWWVNLGFEGVVLFGGMSEG